MSKYNYAFFLLSLNFLDSTNSLNSMNSSDSMNSFDLMNLSSSATETFNQKVRKTLDD